MAKTREFKNIEGVSLFHDTKKCYLNRKGKSLQLKRCTVVELRNIDLQYLREMPSTTFMNFKKPVTCHFDATEKILFCGPYGRK